MFNVTGGELVIIFLVALVILGPERLPKAAREIGKVMGQIRDVSTGFQQELKDAFHEPDEPLIKPSRPQLTALKGGARPEPEPEPGWSKPTTPSPAAGSPASDPATAPAGPGAAAIAAAAPPSALRAVGVAPADNGAAEDGADASPELAAPSPEADAAGPAVADVVGTPAESEPRHDAEPTAT